jgi:hypothetical protein
MKKIAVISLLAVSLSFAACSSGSSSSTGSSGSSGMSGNTGNSGNSGSSGSAAAASYRKTSAEVGKLANDLSSTITQDQVTKIEGYISSAMTDLDTIINSSTSTASCKAAATTAMATLDAGKAYWPTAVGKTWNDAISGAPAAAQGKSDLPSSC